MGTRLITSEGQPALDGVCKLVAVCDAGRWVPTIKISETPAKTLNPGHKYVWRLYDARGKATADLLGLDDEDPQEMPRIRLHHPTQHTRPRPGSDLAVVLVQDGPAAVAATFTTNRLPVWLTVRTPEDAPAAVEDQQTSTSPATGSSASDGASASTGKEEKKKKMMMTLALAAVMALSTMTVSAQDAQPLTQKQVEMIKENVLDNLEHHAGWISS